MGESSSIFNALLDEIERYLTTAETSRNLPSAIKAYGLAMHRLGRLVGEILTADEQMSKEAESRWRAARDRARKWPLEQDDGKEWDRG